MEAVITALIVEIELASRRSSPKVVIQACRKVIPQGVELGERLYQSGELRLMQEGRWSVAQVVD